MALLTASATPAAFLSSQLVGTSMAAIADYCIVSGIANKNHSPTWMNMSACAQFWPYGCTRSQVNGPLHAQSFGDIRPVTRRANGLPSASTICLAALDAKCSAVQTLPRTERSKTMTKAPVTDTVKAPKLDDSGPALPPNGAGGGGGGGGGGDSSGGWILFAILLFLSFLKEKETKEEEEEEKRFYRMVSTLDF